MVIKSTIEDIIREDLAEIWSILNSDEKHLIADHFAVRTYRKGQIIYAEQDEPQFLWVLIKGKVKRFKNGIGGKQQILRLYRPIQYFGYRAWFAHEPYVASTMAIEPSQVGTLPMTIVGQLIDGNIKLAWFFLHELSKHLGGSESKVVTLTQKHIRGRLAEALCMLVDNYGYEDDGKTLKIYMAREDLANLSNMTTANAIRTLSSFAQERIITVDGRRIRIVDETTLRNISRFG
jgi:CRP-like cAMP-binding protein